MAYRYEQPYARAQVADLSKSRVGAERQLNGAGRRSLHWKHLDSNITFDDYGVDYSHTASAKPAHRRALAADNSFARRVDEHGFAHETLTPRRGGKKVLAHQMVHSCAKSSLDPSSFTVKDSAEGIRKFSLRRGVAPSETMNEVYLSRSITPPPTHSKRLVSAEQKKLDTYRVLKTDEEPLPRPSGVRCDLSVRPQDSMDDKYMGTREPKVDRGRRCHYHVPQTLSFTYD